MEMDEAVKIFHNMEIEIAQKVLIKKQTKIHNEQQQLVNGIRTLIDTDTDMAICEALKHEDDLLLFKEIIPLFKEEFPEATFCECGEEFGVSFNVFTLKWIHSTICDACEKRKLQEMRDRQVQKWTESKKKNIYSILKRCNAPTRYISTDKQGFVMADKSLFLKNNPQLQTNIDRVLTGGSQFITGATPGSGKTLFSIVILKEFILDTQPRFEDRESIKIKKVLIPRFTSTANLLNEIRQTYDKDNINSEQAILDKYINTPLLIIDDMCATKTTDFAVNILQQIIDERWNNGMPFVITSNCNLNEIAAIYNSVLQRAGDRIVSRIIGMGDILTFGKIDWRLK